HWRILKPN
ncbi:ABC transporter ATP-binding protein uup, partial [Haemophilus influenzae]